MFLPPVVLAFLFSAWSHPKETIYVTHKLRYESLIHVGCIGEEGGVLRRAPVRSTAGFSVWDRGRWM